jgi:xylulokinase
MDLLRVRDHARFDRLAASSPAGARGALFVAALAGAAAPEPDDRARGMLVGLSFVTGPPEIARAVLEGVGLEMRALVAAMAPALPRIEEVRFTGGGTRSMTWMRILADVLRLPVRRILEPNPGLRGAAQYAWTATGAFGGVLEAARALAPSSEVVDPDPAHEHRYAEAMDLYARVRRCAHQGGLDERLFEHAVDLAGSDRVG